MSRATSAPAAVGSSTPAARAAASTPQSSAHNPAPWRCPGCRGVPAHLIHGGQLGLLLEHATDGGGSRQAFADVANNDTLPNCIRSNRRGAPCGRCSSSRWPLWLAAPPQRKGRWPQLSQNVAPAMAEMKACVGAAHANPADASITVHFPANPTQASILQLTDKSMFSPGDVQTLSHLHNDVPACRKQLLPHLANSFPLTVPVMIRTWSAADHNILKLVQQKITFGEYTTKAKATTDQFMVDYQEALRGTDADLRAADQNEIRNRQAAGTAMMQFLQTQQMVNAMDRPVTTTCTSFGPQINCVSR